MNAISIDNIQMLWLDSLHKIMSGFSARIRAKQKARSDFSRWCYHQYINKKMNNNRQRALLPCKDKLQ